MIRSALRLCAGIILTACFACAPMGQAPALPPPAAMAGAVPTCSATDFAKKIFYVTGKFSPSPGADQPPYSSVPPAGSPNYSQDLQAAFNAGSPDFAQQLCNLDRVYILIASCAKPHCFNESWGWLQSSKKVGKGRIVGLSAGLWNKATYSQYETSLAQSLLPPNFTAVSYSNVNVDTRATELLAALAHEIGHIGWYVVVAPLSAPTSFCGGHFFTASWAKATSPPHDDQGYDFRHFLDYDERQKLRNTGRWLNRHAKSPHIEQIDSPKAGDPPVYASISGLVATGSPWASIFAAMSPDEDFVETYKLKVLTTSRTPLTTTDIMVQGYPPAHLVADYLAGNKPDLTAKAACIPVTLF